MGLDRMTRGRRDHGSRCAVKAIRCGAIGQPSVNRGGEWSWCTGRDRFARLHPLYGARLGVLTGQVGDAAGRFFAADSGVGSVVVVPVQPLGKRCLAFGLLGLGLYVGPFVEQCAVEAFDLAVRLRPPGPSPARADTQLMAGLPPSVFRVGPPGHHLPGTRRPGRRDRAMDTD
jgi:hypothetical protein